VPRPVRSSRPRPDAEPADSTRRRIADAATIEFAAHGFDGARIDAIARRAGVNKALLYYYFPNKAELYRRLLLEHIQAVARTLEEARAQESSPAAALDRMLHALMAALVARPQTADFVLREVLSGWEHLKDDDLRQLFRTSRPIAETVERGIAEGAFRPVEPLFVHLMSVATLSFFIASRAARARSGQAVGETAMTPDSADFVRFASSILTRGLAAAPPHSQGDPT